MSTLFGITKKELPKRVRWLHRHCARSGVLFFPTWDKESTSLSDMHLLMLVEHYSLLYKYTQSNTDRFIRLYPGGHSPGSHHCSMSASLCASTNTCSWKKWSSVSGLAPMRNWRVWCQHTRLRESPVTSLGLSSSDSLLLQKSAYIPIKINTLVYLIYKYMKEVVAEHVKQTMVNWCVLLFC